eukprot:10410002-Alexandrium_andersonii.AAC.1
MRADEPRHVLPRQQVLVVLSAVAPLLLLHQLHHRVRRHMQRCPQICIVLRVAPHELEAPTRDACEGAQAPSMLDDVIFVCAKMPPPPRIRPCLRIHEAWRDLAAGGGGRSMGH